MSQYVNFYIKHKEDYILIDRFSRSSKVYQLIHDRLPYDNGRVLSAEDYSAVMRDIKDEIAHAKKRIADLEKQNESITQMNNSINEKLEAINMNNEFINEYKDDLEDLHYADGVYTTYWGIDDQIPIYAGIEWNPNYNEEE